MGNEFTNTREVKNTKLTFEQEVFCLAKTEAEELNGELNEELFKKHPKYYKNKIEDKLLIFLTKVEKLRKQLSPEYIKARETLQAMEALDKRLREVLGKINNA